MEERLTTAGVAKKDEKYLIAKRQKGGPLSQKWEFIGGKNRFSESIEETLKREWMEEVGVEIEVDKFLLRTEFINKNTHYTLFCYSVTLLSDSFSLNVHEDIRWVGKDELRMFEFGQSDSVIRDYILSNN